MLSFDYTADLQLQDALGEINRLRGHILTIPLSPAAELRLQWEATAIRTWATLALAGLSAPKHHIATILAHPSKPKASTRRIYAMRDAYNFIHSDWRANDKPLTLRSLETLYHIVSSEHESFSRIAEPVRELLAYLGEENAHPVVQASVAHIHLLTQPIEEELGIFARFAHYLILSKYGYDLRGYTSIERIWLEDATMYQKLRERFTADRHMNTWLSFMVQSMKRSYEFLVEDVESKRFHIEFPQTYWQLSDRQKAIMQSIQTLGTTITNKQVQKTFTISQITASRDLTGLVHLGLLFPHGKGRSVYYSRI